MLMASIPSDALAAALAERADKAARRLKLAA
jgi:hypothetical protein